MAKLKQLTSIDDLTLDEKNFNKHTKEGMALLKKSIERNKLGRSVLTDKDGNLIAGNGVTETLKDMPEKPKIRVVDTDGSELVVVRRTDLEVDSQEARELAILDNSTAANNLLWDAAKLKEVADELNITHKELEELGLPGRVLAHIHKDIDRSPIDFSIDKYLYKPTGNPKPIKMCIDTTNYDLVVARIEKAQGLTDAEREVLKLCAYRFIEINMSDMAEYYCHASDAMREAMEDNCLVIVDGKRLIEKGLIKLSEDIQEVLQLEMDEDA